MLPKAGIVSTLLLITAVGLAMAACGGSEEATPTPRPAPTLAAQPTTTAPPTTTVAPQPTATLRPAATVGVLPTPIPRPAPTPTPPVIRQPTGTLHVALGTFGNENLDPICCSSLSLSINGGAMYDWGIWHDAPGSIVPGVIVRWDMAPDARSWTFKVRDMRFHNGQPITAADVKFSLERAVRPDSRSAFRSTWEANLDTVEVQSSDTAVARLKQPWPIMSVFLAPADGSEGIILPKAAIDQLGEKAFFERPVGSGPMKFVQHQTGVRYVFEAAGAHPYRQQPQFKTLELLHIPEESTRVALLRTGAADLIAVSPDSATRLKKDNVPLFRVANLGLLRIPFFGLDTPAAMASKPTAKVEVREALALAMNRQEIIDTLLAGQATVPARDIVIPGTEGFDPAWTPVPYNPARAKQLLAQAGYPNGFTIDFYNAPYAAWTPRAGEAVASYWAEIGVKANLIPIDTGAFSLLFRGSKIPGAAGWLIGFKGHPLRALASVYGSKGATHLFADPALDALLERGPTLTDVPERVRVIHQIVDYAYNNFAVIPVATNDGLYAGGPNISAWEPLNVVDAGLSWERVKQK